MWDILTALFWFGMGAICLAGICARTDAIAIRFDGGNVSNVQ